MLRNREEWGGLGKKSVEVMATEPECEQQISWKRVREKKVGNESGELGSQWAVRLRN